MPDPLPRPVPQRPIVGKPVDPEIERAVFSDDCPTDLGLTDRVPVILVHGFNGDRDSWRSLKSRLATEQPSAALFAFDYRDQNTQWVRHPPIGPKLAKGIACLARHSPTGTVAAVGHSMGGLALRCAVDEVCGGVRGQAARLELVITLGTPHSGTDLLDDWRVEEPRRDRPAKKHVKASCSGRITSSLCSTLRLPLLRGSPASIALLPDGEVSDLPMFPSDTEVVALAGEVTGIGFELFGQRFVNEAKPLSDLVVPTESAVAGATRKRVVNCGTWVHPLSCWHLDLRDKEPFPTVISDEIGSFIARNTS